MQIGQASTGRMLSAVSAPASPTPDLVAAKPLALALLALAVVPLGLPAQGIGPTVVVDARMAAPAWATAQRELIQLNAEAVRVHRGRQFDARGYSLAPPQRGVGAGPDDVTEAIRNWPLAHAVGGADSIIETWSDVWEAHLRQYSEARIPQVEMARDGILHKEFTTAYDWEHIGEGLGPFYFHGLSRPDDARHVERARRYAGFYMNEDPDAPNYDPKRRIIRSLFNGSRGADLTPATVDDWDGPLPDGVSPTAARRTRFANPANQNIRGDHPLNLSATMLHLNESFDADEVRLTLVNVGAERARTVTVQMGASGEHRATTVTSGGRRTTVNGPWFNVRLAPGAGQTLTIGVRRYANQPTLAFPWARPAGR